jgi:hypothetical protein
VQFGQVLTAALGALLAAVEDAGELPDIELQLEVVAEEAREAVNRDNIVAVIDPFVALPPT